jgi:hypothetical protein
LAGGRAIIGLSDKSDGNMRTIGKAGADLKTVRASRDRFLQKLNLTPAQTVLEMVGYDRGDFCRYARIDQSWEGRGMTPDRAVEVYDGLATRKNDLGIFLPLADCQGAVIFDLSKNVLAVAHLGRQSVEQRGALKAVE